MEEALCRAVESLALHQVWATCQTTSAKSNQGHTTNTLQFKKGCETNAHPLEMVSKGCCVQVSTPF